MADLQPKDMNKRKENSDAALERLELVTAQWRKFAHEYGKEAYQELMDYIEMQDYFAILAAKGPISTFSEEDGQQVKFDRENAAALLQRSVGYDIVKTYVEGYVNPTTL